MPMMTNDNDSGVGDDDYGNDGDGVRHRPPLPAISRPPALLDGGPEWGARKAQRGTVAMVDNDDNRDDDDDGIC